MGLKKDLANNSTTNLCNKIVMKSGSEFHLVDFGEKKSDLVCDKAIDSAELIAIWIFIFVIFVEKSDGGIR